MKKNISKNRASISDWVKSRNWSKKPKAVCKPCWEIKYCPYGPLVEDFPIAKIDDEKRCKIFGHECPVFSVAEPFTETKELRNITRQIPRTTQFRVLKRENQICSSCGNAVKDEDIEFDHIIPWSLGGSSDESNIRLLCMKCNRKKGKKFEEEYLIQNYNDHMSEPDTENSIHFLTILVAFAQNFKKENNYAPTPHDFADGLAGGDLTLAEKMAAEYFSDLSSFFSGRKPIEITKEQFEALKFRWGFKDGIVYKIKDVKRYLNLSEDDYLLAEKNLIQRIGIRMSTLKSVEEKWKRL